MDEEEKNKEGLEVISMITYENVLDRAKVFDHLWSLEEQQTILGLLKGRKMKKKLKDKKEKNV